jgi:hypothetical protein
MTCARSACKPAPALGLYGVWINGTKVADAKGLWADKAARPGVVLRAFDA